MTDINTQPYVADDFILSPPSRRPTRPKSKQQNHVWKRKHPKTNTLSPSQSRPGPGTHTMFVKKEVQDIVRHNAVDIVVTQTLHRKTGCPRFVSPAHPHEHKVSMPRRGRKARPDRCVCLPDLHQNLFLGNMSHAKKMFGDFHSIMNLTEDSYKCRGTRVVQFNLHDDKRVDYNSFRTIMLDAANQIHAELSDRKRVLVHCHAGVNRSVSAVIVYAVLHQQYTVKQAIDMVIRTKAEFHGRWSTLSNHTFAKYLSYIENEKAAGKLDSVLLKQ